MYDRIPLTRRPQVTPHRWLGRDYLRIVCNARPRQPGLRGLAALVAHEPVASRKSDRFCERQTKRERVTDTSEAECDTSCPQAATNARKRSRSTRLVSKFATGERFRAS